MNENEQYTFSEAPETSQPEQPVYPLYSQPVYPQYSIAQPSGTPVLVMGILALAFANTFYLAFLGIIFGAICKGRLSAYLEAGGRLCGQAKVGRILGKIGLILGIVFTALLIVLFCLMLGGNAVFESIFDSGYDLSGGTPFF